MVAKASHQGDLRSGSGFGFGDFQLRSKLQRDFSLVFFGFAGVLCSCWVVLMVDAAFGGMGS